MNSCKTGASPCVSCSRGKEQVCEEGRARAASARHLSRPLTRRARTQFCREKTVFTYNTKLEGGGHTFGGYSSRMVADERFVLRMPPNLPLAASAPLLCAGITTYAPLVEHGLNVPGTKLAVVGLGGLGSMAVRLAKAFGCVVTVVSHSPRKEAEARALGADAFIVSSDPEAMKAAAGTLDGVVDTVAADHDVAALLGLLATEGKMVLLGVPPTAYTIPAGSIVVGARTLVGSLIGGVQMTQDCLDFCAKHNIVSSIELIPVDKINEAYERLRKARSRVAPVCG